MAPPSTKPRRFVQAHKTTRLRHSNRYRRSLPEIQIPIGRARPNSAISCPRFPPREAFERRPPRRSNLSCWGLASETLHQSGRSERLSAGSDPPQHAATPAKSASKLGIAAYRYGCKNRQLQKLRRTKNIVNPAIENEFMRDALTGSRVTTLTHGKGSVTDIR
jgi:hypothetical protein